jgi:hypothetical protein
MLSPQIIRLLDVLPVTEARNASGVTPRSLIIKGKDFRSVETVLMNDMVSPEFAVYSPTELVAQVPDVLAKEVISSIMVMSSTLTLTDRSIVEFTVGTRVRKVGGMVRLMQVFLRQLFRTRGSNIFHRELGGGLLRRVGTTITNTTAADVALAVNNAKQTIIASQAVDRRIPPSERLLEAEILSMNADPQQTSVSFSVRLTNHSGQSGAAALVV